LTAGSVVRTTRRILVELRSERMPPPLDEAKVARLAELAAALDGVLWGLGEDDLVEFNRLAGTSLRIEEFQGIYGGEDHEDWVRRVLYYQTIEPAAAVTREELIEVVRRAMPQNEYFEQHEAYMAVFDANVPLEGASNLIFYPPDDVTDPTPEQIVEWAFDRRIGPGKETGGKSP
jgi:hypothetical protein